MEDNTKNKLKAAIAERGLTIRRLSEISGIDIQLLYLSVQGKREFRISEVKKITKALGLDTKERDAIFYD